ncbi:MAG TPA: glycosyltransferase [Candidatus Dormibacteraeota bacterium]|jgi:glycosyltransferase involved in cell wall biosynthesis|nr:glycosyltransferase [Candidatus Dormibacteraeota bacterium]
MRDRLDVAVVAPLVAPLRAATPYGNHVLVVDLARELAARGHQVTLYCAAESEPIDGVERVEIAVSRAARRAFVLLDPDRPPIPAMHDAFARLFARVRRGGHDVVSQHAFDAEAIELAEGLPVLHTLHLPPFVARVVQAARETSAPLAVVSFAMQRAWLGAGVATTVVPNGVPDRPALRASVRRVALVAGRISPEKGTATAIRLARRAGLAPLVVGEPYHRAYFESSVRPQLRGGELRAPVSRSFLGELMARSAVTLCPIGWDEPFGLVAAEAQVAGCPVVAYRRGAMDEVVEDGVSGILVPPDDEEIFLAGIRRALGLRRAHVRASARRRLLLGPAIDAYEARLGELARSRIAA